jgi:hypothetical protein
MTTKRLALLFVIVALGFSATFLLPKSAAQPSGILLHLPDSVAGWTASDAEISQKERDTLGPGTEFARKWYTHPQFENYKVQISIVLSGHDMSNSIHRPERCLNAQGWVKLGSEEVPIVVKDHGTFSTTRLHNRRTALLKEGQTVVHEAYSYYWFVGEDVITASHIGRFLQDNRDRFFRGVNQRWAFITVTAFIPKRETAEEQAEAEKWVDDNARKLIQNLAPSIHKEGVRYF